MCAQGRQNLEQFRKVPSPISRLAQGVQEDPVIAGIAQKRKSALRAI
jgi:hypothetical protein